MKISEENLKEAENITGSCTCSEGFVDRNLIDPACINCGYLIEIASALQAKSDEIAALKARIAELEEKLSKSTGFECQLPHPPKEGE